MLMTGRRLLIAIVLCTLGLGTAGAAQAPAASKRHFTAKKSIWGPVTRHGKSQFPIYHDLGVGIWQ